MFRKILGLFLGWKLLLLSSALIAPLIFPVPPNQWRYLGNTIYPNAHFLNWVWANFDGAHYLYTVINGYREYNFAFFPFLPLTIYLIHKIFPISPLTAGIIISNLAFFCSLFVVYKIIIFDYSKKIAWKTLLFLVIFPVSFYYGAVYPESIYLLLASLSFYFARKSRWLLAGFLGYLAGLTRFFGIVLLPALLIEWAQQNKKLFLNFQKNFLKIIAKFFRSRAYSIFLIPLGLVTFSAYLQIKYGDFLLFQKSLANWSQDKFVFPIQTLYRYLKIIFLFPNKTNYVYWVAILELITTFCYFFLSFYVAKKIRLSYGLFMLLFLIIPTCTGKLESMPRYILHLFPGFLAITLLTQNNKILFWATSIVFLALNFLFTALFTRGYFLG